MGVEVEAKKQQGMAGYVVKLTVVVFLVAL